MSVRNLGGLGRVISMDYANNSTVQNEFLSVVEILAKLKTEIEKQVNFPDNKNRSEIKRELASLKDRLVVNKSQPKIRGDYKQNKRSTKIILTHTPSQAHLKGTQSPYRKPTLQKSLPCSYGTSYFVDTYMIDEFISPYLLRKSFL